MDDNKKSMSPFDIAKSINNKSEYIEFENNSTATSAMNVFMLNKIYSKFQDTIFIANEVNAFTNNIKNNKQMIYDFYYYMLPKRNRFSKWNKKSFNEYDEEILVAIMDKMNYSREKAIDTYKLLSKDVLKNIKNEIEFMKNPYRIYKAKKKKVK